MKFSKSLKKFHKKVLAVSAVFAALLCLSACTRIKVGAPKGTDLFLQIEDAGCTRKEAVILLMEEKAAYEEGGSSAGLWEKPVGSGTMTDYVKSIVEDKLTRYTAAGVMSDRYAAYPSEEAKNRAGEDAVTAWTRISGMYDVDAYDLTASDVHNLYYKKAVYDAVYDRITEDASKDITEESTRVILADYVLIPKSIGEQTAESILAAVRQGEDFAQTAAQAGYPVNAGQKLKRGDLNQTADAIAFALYDGEWSEVIESKDGFYIIHCLDDNLVQDSAANYNEMLASVKEKAFRDAYYEFSSQAKIWIDRKFLEELDLGSIQ